MPNWGMKTMTDPKTPSNASPGRDIPAAFDDVDLDVFFAAARETAPDPAPDFMARLTQEALAEMPVAPARAPAAVPGLWAQVRQAIGGWPGLAGLAAACAAGVWIGVSPPTGLDALWGTSVALESLDPIGSFGLALMEG